MLRWVRRPSCCMTCPPCTSRPTPQTGSVSRGSQRERRLDPQITLWLLTDVTGFPLMVEVFRGNKAEAKTMFPVIEVFMTAHPVA